MSPEVIAALVGALVGIVGGIVANHFVRHMGRVMSEPSGWDLKFLTAPNFYGEKEELDIERADEAVELEYSFDLDFFNGRDMPTGLRNLTVVLVCKDGKLVSEPQDRATSHTNTFSGRMAPTPIQVTSFEKMSVINLPPRQWVHKEVKGEFEPKEGVTIREWQRVELFGKWPSWWRRTFKKTIAKR